MPILSKYNGKDIIILDPNIEDPYIPFSFGVAKARVILDRMGDIEKWLKNLPTGSGKPLQLDITPQIHQGKRFILNRYKAKLILENKHHIEEFVNRADIKTHQKFANHNLDNSSDSLFKMRMKAKYGNSK